MTELDAEVAVPPARCPSALMGRHRFNKFFETESYHRSSRGRGGREVTLLICKWCGYSIRVKNDAVGAR